MDLIFCVHLHYLKLEMVHNQILTPFYFILQ